MLFCKSLFFLLRNKAKIISPFFFSRHETFVLRSQMLPQHQNLQVSIKFNIVDCTIQIPSRFNSANYSAESSSLLLFFLIDILHFQFKFSNSSETLAYGDCFVVESSWVIKNIPDEQNRCRVDFFVHLLWTKRTMFKSVIEKASIDRTKDFILKWVSDAKEYLNGPQKGGNAFDGSSPSRNISSSSGPRRRSTSSRTEGRPAEKEQSGSFLMGIFYFFLLGLIGLGLYLGLSVICPRFRAPIMDTPQCSSGRPNPFLERCLTKTNYESYGSDGTQCANSLCS